MPRRRGRSADRGSATVWVLLAMTLVWSFTTWGLTFTAVAANRARASTAADLASLAGAADAVLGDIAACARASRVAEANRAVLTSCTVDADLRTVELVVEVRGRGLLARAAPTVARSRAGPR